jgi:hypothetical protein
MGWGGITGSVISGVLVALVLGLGRLLWHRARVPHALSRQVRRRSYLSAVYAASRQPGIRRLDVLAPRLSAAEENQGITRIQSAWELINQDGKVRVLTLDSEECLRAGAELLSRGIEVRIAHRGLNSESLTFHLFEMADPGQAQAIINRHYQGVDRPGRRK